MSYKKSTTEQKHIIDGGKILGAILEELSEMVRPGVTSAEIDAHAEARIREAGGIPAFKGYKTRSFDPPFPGTICACINEEVVHGIPSATTRLADGDIFSIDIGMQYQGLFTDTALTVPVGTIPQATQKLLSVTREALEVGLRACVVGNTVADIGRAIESYVQSQGEYGIVRDLVGHGVGHAVHEEPRVANYYDTDLEQWEIVEGLVVALEPMLTLGTHEVDTADDSWTIVTRDGSLSAHFEHTVVITADGPVVATRRPSENA